MFTNKKTIDNNNVTNESTFYASILRPPLLVAAEQGDLDEVKNLVDQGENINEEDKLGRTPLSYAALGGHIEVVQFLVGRHAHLNDISKLGWTPLLVAAGQGQVAVVDYLVQKRRGGESCNCPWPNAAILCRTKRASSNGPALSYAWRICESRE